MQTFVVTFLFFAGVMLAMAIGVMVHGRRLKGSCGGPGEDCPCDEVAQRDCEIKRRRQAAHREAA
jgi:hypothetical protein